MSVRVHPATTEMKTEHVVAIIAAVVLAYFLFLRPSAVEGMSALAPYPFGVSPGVGLQLDGDAYDAPNADAFGTTAEANRRVTNYGVRPEFHKNPMPLGYGCGDCDKAGVPDPAPGHTHVCKAGLPSKRMIDAYGGSHHMLPHMCKKSTECEDSPPNLGRFWCRKGCSNVDSVGLDIRPACTRCGN